MQISPPSWISLPHPRHPTHLGHHRAGPLRHTAAPTSCLSGCASRFQLLGWEDPLEKGKATHSVFWPGEFHGLQSMGSQRVRHDWVTFTFTSASFLSATAVSDMHHPRWAQAGHRFPGPKRPFPCPPVQPKHIAECAATNEHSGCHITTLRNTTPSRDPCSTTEKVTAA